MNRSRTKKAFEELTTEKDILSTSFRGSEELQLTDPIQLRVGVIYNSEAH